MVKARAIRKAEVDEREAEAERARVNEEARAYLRDTDWYVIRQADTGEPVPEDIRLKRIDAREAVT